MDKDPLNRISVILGDITKVDTDAVVNAANESLLGGFGVDGAIHEAAGPELLEECKKLHGCETGDAKITRGYNLPAKYIIHAVGPYYLKGYSKNAPLLAKTYRRSLEVAREHGLNSIAFPSISTGYFQYPIGESMSIVFDTVVQYLKEDEKMYVVFVMFSKESFDLYAKYLRDLSKAQTK